MANTLGAAALAAQNGQPPAVTEPEQRFYCHGCGRGLFWYTPEPLSAGKRMRFRCRDCKAWSVLEGPQVVGALRAVGDTITERG